MSDNEIRQLIAFFQQSMLNFIDQAKARGVTMVKVPGFEAAWDLRAAPHPSLPPPPRPAAPIGYVRGSDRLDELAQWVMPMFQEWRGRTLSEIPRKNLQSLLEWLEKDGPEELNDTAREVLKVGWEYLRLLESEGR